MKNNIVLSILILAAVGCDGLRDREQVVEEAPPAAAVAPITGMPLDTALALLDVELRAAIENKLDDTGYQRFQRAEALTDRLLETRYPFQWLKGQAYSVESKLRQVQALADRVLAMKMSGVPVDSAMPDLQMLRAEVVWLREALRGGGGPPPPPLAKLLAGEDTGKAAAPIGAAPDVDDQ